MGIPVEAAERDLLIAVVSLADSEVTLAAFTDALVGSIERRRGEPRPIVGAGSTVSTRSPCWRRGRRSSPPAVAVPTGDAVGRVSAELVAPYPPGIPVLAPGEEITEGTLDALHQARAAGVRIAYAADPTLGTLRVVR